MKTAIFLRGHARTWNLVKYQNLAFLNKCYDELDWYVLFPTTTTVTINSLHADFYKSSLIYCKFVNEEHFKLPYVHRCRWDSYCPEYWKLAWLDYQLGIELRKQELLSGIKYDKIIFARPDCEYDFFQTSTSAKTVGTMEIAANLNSGAYFDSADQSDIELADDLCYTAGRSAAGLLMLRYLESQWTDLPNQLVHPNPCALLASYCIKHSMVIDTNKKFISSTLVRPQYIGYTEWSHLDTTSKMHACGEFNIDPKDYQLIN